MTMVILFSLGIVLARIVDVSMATIRTLMIVQGRRTIALTLGFFEILIWIGVVSGVITHASEQPLYAVAYALGFALGNYVGMTIERKLALGNQVVRIITRQGPELAQALREAGMRVTQFDGYGRDGPVQELFVEVLRRQAPGVVEKARALDSRCYYTIDDIRQTSTPVTPLMPLGSWRAVFPRK